jgi:hypothetical protein
VGRSLVMGPASPFRSPGWEYRVGNPGYNDTKSAFAD